VIADLYHEDYPEVDADRDRIADVLTKEERSFGRTLRKGLAAMRRLGRSGVAVDGSALFELHDTFGMPVELSVEEARRTGIRLSPTWQAEYDGLMAEQRARSHQARAAVDPTTV
jgi:alanyl-tRNA synthetase